METLHELVERQKKEDEIFKQNGRDFCVHCLGEMKKRQNEEMHDLLKLQSLKDPT